MQTVFNRIAIFGVGLIGGSFALALKKSGSVKQIVGVGRSRASLETAQQLGIIDDIADSVEEAVTGSDLILIAAPVAQTESILRAIAPFLAANTIVTAHPIAGRELNGPEAALTDLYVGKKVVITRLPENTNQSVAAVAWAWQQCGAIIHQLNPAQHDAVFAAVSHLPHLLAYALVDDVARKPHADTLFQYAASGFRDFTRIAGSSPEMWRDITLANRVAMLEELDSYTARLAILREHLVQADGAAIEGIYSHAQKARHNWISAIEAAEKQQREGGD